MKYVMVAILSLFLVMLFLMLAGFQPESPKQLEKE